MLSLFMLAALAVYPAIAQILVVEVPQSVSQFRGTVTDCQGFPLPEVKVSVREIGRANRTKRHVIAETASDEGGRFRLSRPRPNKYELLFEISGFDTLSFNVELADASRAQYKGQLHVHMPISGGGSCDFMEPFDSRFVLPDFGSAISSRTDWEALRRRFGAANVTDGEVPLGEGETEPGTILFGKDRRKRVEILWKYPKNTPAHAQVYGEKSEWRTVRGITLGTTLKRLEELNGGPFKLAGFEWDYSGTVTSWEGGKLERDLESINLRLEPSRKASDEDVTQVAGESEFSSQHPIMQKLNPRVYFILVELK
jgi:hypothetical protein